MLAVRPAASADAAAIAQLAQLTHAFHAAALPHVFQPPAATVVSAADVAQRLARPERVVLVATLDDAFAGFAHAEAVARGLATVSLDVYAFNAGALALYEREGFAPLRTRLVAPASPP